MAVAAKMMMLLMMMLMMTCVRCMSNLSYTDNVCADRCSHGRVVRYHTHLIYSSPAVPEIAMYSLLGMNADADADERGGCNDGMLNSAEFDRWWHQRNSHISKD